MRKFLAVLLAVAILGVAGAAFAADAGHVTPTPTSNKHVDVDATKLTTVATKLAQDISSDDVKSALGDAASKVTISEVTDSADKIKAHAEKKEVVVAVLPKLTPTETVDVKLPVSFDKTYAGKPISVDMGVADVPVTILLAGAIAPYYETTAGVSTDKVPEKEPYVVNLVATLEKGKAYAPVAVIAAADVADLDAFKDAVTEYDVDEDLVLQVSKDYGAEPIVIKATKSASSSEKAATDGKLVVAFGQFSFDKAGVYLTEGKSFSNFSNASGDMTVVFDSEYVTVAAETLSDGAVYDSSTKQKVTSGVITGTGSVAFKVNSLDSKAHTVGVVADKKTTPSTDPTSNKGSGGCNGGFAGIAVLALGLAALRRKAR